jgi:hypothetical protein
MLRRLVHLQKEWGFEGSTKQLNLWYGKKIRFILCRREKRKED